MLQSAGLERISNGWILLIGTAEDATTIYCKDLDEVYAKLKEQDESV